MNEPQDPNPLELAAEYVVWRKVRSTGNRETLMTRTIRQGMVARYGEFETQRLIQQAEETLLLLGGDDVQ